MTTNPDGPLSIEEANQLVVDNRDWAEGVARAVARGWNLDWQSDGLDGAAFEALLFCARRFDPSRGVPFRGYARKRVHEAATEAARKTKGWRKPIEDLGPESIKARNVAASLVDLYPELRDGQISFEDTGNDVEGFRGAIREMLVGASLLSVREGIEEATPEEMVDYRKMVTYVTSLEPIHQLLLWKVYWEGNSMRTVATEWEIDELNVIREHKELLVYLQKSFAKGKPGTVPQIRPGLRATAKRYERDDPDGPFSRLLQGEAP